MFTLIQQILRLLCLDKIDYLSLKAAAMSKNPKLEPRIDASLIFDPEKVLLYFFEPVLDFLNKIFLNTRTIELTIEEQARINSLSHTEHGFSLMVDNRQMRCYVYNDALCPFNENSFSVKSFLDYLHPQFWIPFLTYAQFGYELAKSDQISADEVMTASYRIPVPLLNKATKKYNWYIQKAYPLTIDENKFVTKHINFYQFERSCAAVAEDAIENRYIEATVFQNAKLLESFQQRLNFKVGKFIRSILKEHPQHYKIIQLLLIDIEMPVEKIASSFSPSLKKETITKYKSEIITFLCKCTGYKHDNIKSVIAFLKDKGYLTS